MNIKKTMRSALAIFLALGLLCACTPAVGPNEDTSGDDLNPTESVEDTTEDTTQEETTQPEPEIPEELRGITVSLTSLTADGTSFAATVNPSADLEGQLFLTFKQGDQTVEFNYEIDLMENEDYEIAGENVPFLSGTYTLDVQAVVDEYVIDEYTVAFNKGIPQLSLRSVDMVVAHMPVKEKANFVVAWMAPHNMAARTYGTKAYNAKAVLLADGPGGLRTDHATVAYPVGTNLASTWDRELIQTVAASIGDDCFQYGVGVLLGPGMNIQKNVRCGRNFEYFSEDPFLTGMMGGYYTLGVQSQGVGVALKHFATNNQETDRGGVSSEVTERALREIYLRGYEYTIKLGDPYTVMSSYNRLNGSYTAANRELLETILRDELGFDGMVMSDWGAQGGRVGMLRSGNDLACGFGNTDAEINIIVDAVEDGRMDEEFLNVSCKRVLTLLAKSADAIAASGRKPSGEIVNRTEKDALVRQAGAESMVLLKNDNNTLPLQGGELALFAANSYNLVYCGGGSGSVIANDVAQLPTAIQAADGFSLNQTVAALYEGFPQYEITPEIAAEAASQSDCAIFTIARLSVEGNDHQLEAGDFLLSDIERMVLENVSEAFHAEGKPVIVLLNVGSAVEVVSWRDMADAILLVGFAGEEIGYSIMDVLSGKVNPAAKLTCTWPLSYDDVPDKDHFGTTGSTLYYDDIYVGYRYYTTFGVDVAYPFGYGLSYTSFEYSNFSVAGDDGEYELSVTVKNTGNVAGREIVQFYVTKSEWVNEHAALELVGFDKTAMLQPGEEETITVKVGLEELKTYYTEEAQWIVEPGEYMFHVGASVNDIHYRIQTVVADEILVLQTVNACGPTKELDVLSKNG